MAKRSLFDQLDQAITQLLAQPNAQPTAVDPEIAPLVRIASELRDLPRTAFMERLKTDLERSTAMATTTEPVAAVRTVGRAKNSVQETQLRPSSSTRRPSAPGRSCALQIGEQIPHAEITIGDSIHHAHRRMAGRRSLQRRDAGQFAGRHGAFGAERRCLRPARRRCRCDDCPSR